MGTVVAQASMSLDGYIAKEDNSIGLLFDWLQAGDVEISTATAGITFHLSPASAAYWRESTADVGAIVCGRRLFDFVGGWGGRHTMDVPVVVVTHRVPTEWVRDHPGAPFEFVTDGVAAAVARAQDIAGPGTVWVSAGTIAPPSACSRGCWTSRRSTWCPWSWAGAVPSSPGCRPRTSRWAIRRCAFPARA
jgi:dihydrofolate reductase